MFCVKKRDYLLGSPGTQRCWIFSVKRRDTISSLLKGTWCSGITSAPHAEGPGLKPQCAHVQEKRSPGTQRCWVFLLSSQAFLAAARAVLGIEPRTSRTLSENHATRPNSQLMSTQNLHRFLGLKDLHFSTVLRRQPSRDAGCFV